MFCHLAFHSQKKEREREKFVKPDVPLIVFTPLVLGSDKKLMQVH